MFRNEVNNHISEYQSQVVAYTKKTVEEIVSEYLKTFVPETVELGIKGVQKTIAEALDIARDEMEGAIDACVPLAFAKKKFSWFDAGVVTATKNKEMVEFFYSYIIRDLVGASIVGTTKTEYYKIDTRFWG